MILSICNTSYTLEDCIISTDLNNLSSSDPYTFNKYIIAIHPHNII